MSNGEIQELIDKYYRGETSLEEDQKLMTLLKSDKSSSYASEKAQFYHYHVAKSYSSINRFNEYLLQKKNTSRSKSIFSNQVFRIAAGLLIIFSVGYKIFQLTNQSIEIVTDSNTTKEIQLEDGSKISLHYNSKLIYPKHFDKTKREIYLEGEAFFNISKNIDRPFVVHNFQTNTTVLGTLFNLRGYPTDSLIQLSVISGLVSFGSDSVVKVSAGIMVDFEKTSSTLSELKPNHSNTTAWYKKELVFENAELNSVFNDIEKYFNIKIEINNQELAHCHFTGRFTEPTLSDVLSVMKYSLKLNYIYKKGIYYISGKGCE